MGKIRRGGYVFMSIRGAVVKIRSVRINNRRKAFEVRTSSRRLLFPFAKVDPRPTVSDPITRVFVDRELGSEGFGFVLRSEREGSVHIEQVLQTNYRKSVDQLLSLLQVLDCEVRLVVRPKSA